VWGGWGSAGGMAAMVMAMQPNGGLTSPAIRSLPRKAPCPASHCAAGAPCPDVTTCPRLASSSDELSAIGLDLGGLAARAWRCPRGAPLTRSPCSLRASASNFVGAAQVNPFASMSNLAPNYAGGVGQITASGAIIKFYTISGSATVRSTGQAGTSRWRAPLALLLLAPPTAASARAPLARSSVSCLAAFPYQHTDEPIPSPQIVSRSM